MDECFTTFGGSSANWWVDGGVMGVYGLCEKCVEGEI